MSLGSNRIAALTAAAAMLIAVTPGSVLSEMRWGASDGEEDIPCEIPKFKCGGTLGPQPVINVGFSPNFYPYHSGPPRHQ